VAVKVSLHAGIVNDIAGLRQLFLGIM
jgi:hypothetical protein